MSKQSSTLSKYQVIWTITMFVFVIVAWVANFYLLRNNAEASAIGSLFGATSALFTGLAFAGLIFTILLQKNELTLQRQELSETRQEFAEQNKTLKQQRFENTFFNMLNVHHQIIGSIPTGLVTGRLALNDISNRYLLPFVHSINLSHFSETKLSNTEMYELSEKIAIDYKMQFYNEFEHIFNHYFRNLYHIYKYIYFSDLSVEEKDFYGSLVGAQLSQYEFLLLAFNGLVKGYGKPKFLYLMREFEILRNFRKDQIPDQLMQTLIAFEVNNAEYPFNHEKPHKRRII